MALKFDMGNASWARQMAAQRQAQTASTLGRDIGSAIAMGVGGLASKVKAKAEKRWGKDLVEAQNMTPEQQKKKYGQAIPKEGMDWKEFRKLGRQSEKRRKTFNKLKDNEAFNAAYESDKQAHDDRMKSERDATNPYSISKRQAQIDFPEKSDWLKGKIKRGTHKDILRKEFGKGALGVGKGVLGAALSPLALAGGLVKGGANLLGANKDKRQERKNLREANRAFRGETDYRSDRKVDRDELRESNEATGGILGRALEGEGDITDVLKARDEGTKINPNMERSMIQDREQIGTDTHIKDIPTSSEYNPQSGEYVDDQGFGVAEDLVGYEAEKTKTPGFKGFMQRAIPGGYKGYDWNDPHEAYLDKQFKTGPLAQFINQQWQSNPFQPPSNDYGVNLNEPDPFAAGYDLNHIPNNPRRYPQ